MSYFLMGGDQVFLTNRALPYFGLKEVRVAWSNSRKKFPDIWVNVAKSPPMITVTQEWLKQTPTERRKRLVHELLHAKGLKHGIVGIMDYNTRPSKDEFSMAVYQDIIAGGTKFDPWMLK